MQDDVANVPSPQKRKLYATVLQAAKSHKKVCPGAAAIGWGGSRNKRAERTEGSGGQQNVPTADPAD